MKKIKMRKMSRGLRNSNPLNIRRNSTQWQGLAAVQSDSAFFQFTAPEWGYRAAIKTLQNYRRLHGLTTVEQMVSRWAPSSENNTTGYIAAVCARTGWPRGHVVDVDDEGEMCSIVEAMSFVENGVPANSEAVHKAWRLL